MTAWPGPRPIVWAPSAGTVEVVVVTPDGEERRPLRLVGAHDPGYWGADEELELGTTFGFSVDGGPTVADPLATWLPDGIYSLSRVLGQPEPAGGWTDDAWRPADLARGALLHLDVESATPQGTFEAAIPLLPRIAAAGVDGVELAPLCTYDESLGRSGGVRIYSVHEPMGGAPGLAAFVDAAHAAGLGVVLTPSYRWAATPLLGLETFGPYAEDGRLNLDGSGSRGPRDFLVSNAEWWFLGFHVDGLSLDVEALGKRSGAPFVTALADATVGFSEDLGRPLTLYIDGPGRSDRLIKALRGLLLPDVARVADEAVRNLARLTRLLSPTARLPLRAERLSHRVTASTARAASLVVGDLTRLPGARRAVPWAPADEVVEQPDVDALGSTLTFVVMAGTPLVLDTDHLPVDRDDADAQRLLAWTRDLTVLRRAVAGDTSMPIEVRGSATALAVRRARHAIVLGWGVDDDGVDLAEVLPGEPGAWELVTAWDPQTSLDGGVLKIRGRTTAVLRARS